MNSRRRLWRIVGLLGAILLVIAGRDMVGDYVVPALFQIGWRIYVIVDSLPQIIIWGVLLAVLLAIAAGSLRSDPTRGAFRSAPPPRHDGRVVVLARDLSRMEHSDYFRRAVIRELRKLTLDVIGQQERLTPAEARRRLETGRFSQANEIRAYLAANEERNPVSSPLSGRLAQLRDRLPFPRRRHPVLDPELQAIIHFLETELETDTTAPAAAGTHVEARADAAA